MSEKLKPCPFCGGKAIETRSSLIYCEGCDAQGPRPEYNTEKPQKRKRSRELWNRREGEERKERAESLWCTKCGSIGHDARRCTEVKPSPKMP